MTHESEIRERKTYTFRNEDTTPRSVIIEHPVRVGYQLRGDVQPVESTPAWHRFRLRVDAKQTASLVVDEARLEQATYDLSDIDDDQVALFVKQQSINKTLEDALRRVLAQKAVIAGLESDKKAHEDETEQIFDDQQRLRENMKALRGSSEEKALLQRYTQQLNDAGNTPGKTPQRDPAARSAAGHRQGNSRSHDPRALLRREVVRERSDSSPHVYIVRDRVFKGWRGALCCALAWTVCSNASVIVQLKVVEGEGMVYHPGTRATRGLTVLVTDENGQPIRNAAVSFRLPDEGPSGVFSSGLRTEVVTTGSDGLASVWGMQWNKTAGAVQIRITAIKDQARAGIVSTEYPR